MNKYTLGTIIGTGLLGLAKSKLSGSGAKAVKIGPFYNQYTIGAHIAFKFKNRNLQPNMVINFDKEEEFDFDIWEAIYSSPKIVLGYSEDFKRSEHMKVQMGDSFIGEDRDILFEFSTIRTRSDGSERRMERDYHLKIINLDIRIDMMVPYRSAITNGEIADLIEKEINFYLEKFFAENPDFEEVERNQQYHFQSEVYKRNGGYDEDVSTRLSTSPDDKLFDMVTSTYNELGIVKIPERPFFVVSSYFLQDCPYTIMKKDELLEPDVDEWDLKYWGKYGDIRPKALRNNFKKRSVPKLRKR